MTQQILVPAGNDGSRDLTVDVTDGLPLETVRKDVVPAVVERARSITRGIIELVQMTNDTVAVVVFSTRQNRVRVKEIIPVTARLSAFQHAIDELRDARLDDGLREAALDALLRRYHRKA